MTRLEVRCCCQPNKLLGWLYADADRDVVLSRLVSPSPVPLMTDANSRVPIVPERCHQITMEIATIALGEGFQPYRAIKAEGVPIETLRRIPGFIEYHGGQTE